MKKLILKNLKAEQLSTPELKKIHGGTSCSAYYCEFVNPDAVCCGGTPPPPNCPGDPGCPTDPPPPPPCPPFYCAFVNPSAACCY